jgi:hypothetical protein
MDPQDLQSPTWLEPSRRLALFVEGIVEGRTYQSISAVGTLLACQYITVNVGEHRAVIQEHRLVILEHRLVIQEHHMVIHQKLRLNEK